MAREDVTRKVEYGRFEDLSGGELAKLLDEVHRRAGGAVPECIICESPVLHPIDIEHLQDRYTRSRSTDGVVVQVDIRGIKMDTKWCRPCSDSFFDQGCHALGLTPVTDVTRRLEVTRDDLVSMLARRERELGPASGRESVHRDHSYASCVSTFVSRRDVGVKKIRNRASRARHRSGAASKQLGDGDITRKSLQGLRVRIRELEKLGVDGIPDDDVPRICAKTRELLLARRYMPLRHIAADIQFEALEKAGQKAPGRSKFRSPSDGEISEFRHK